MAREIRGVSDSGTLYARIINRAGLWWNGTTFEAYSTANYGTYDVAMTEQGDSGVYVADFPAGITTGGTYEVYVHLQAGGSPAEGDLIVSTGRVDWTGTAIASTSTSAMVASDFLAYILRKGFKRTDKNTELYEAMTDAVQKMRRRFAFDEAKAEAESTDTIDTLGDFKLDIESDLGLLLGIVLEDGGNAIPLVRKSKSEFDDLYPWINVDTSRGYPRHYCVYAGQIYIGPAPDSVSYDYRLSYSKRAGTITSTSSVPFTDLYRDVLAQLVMSIAYEGLEEYDKANYHEAKFEAGFLEAVQRERKNAGETGFIMGTMDC